ncbi:MAG: DUF1161 domain-containing protein [Thermodesulfobacteriota bacterium]|jgi:hypothetical protein
MKRIILSLVLVTAFSCTSAFAQIKSCEELKTEIEAKLKAKGVEGYTLEIIPTDQVKDQKIIGSCEGGTKKISYSRTTGK